MAGYYDKKKDYSKELQRSDLTDQERSQLQQERQNKIDAVYGGVEPNMAGKSYTYSRSQKGGSSSGGGNQYSGTFFQPPRWLWTRFRRVWAESFLPCRVCLSPSSATCPSG